jgi:hypothetical protein
METIDSKPGSEPECLALLTEEEIRGLRWHNGGWKFAIIDLRTRDVPDSPLWFMSTYTSSDYIRMLTYMREIARDKDNLLCGKVQLVTNPYL